MQISSKQILVMVAGGLQLRKNVSDEEFHVDKVLAQKPISMFYIQNFAGIFMNLLANYKKGEQVNIHLPNADNKREWESMFEETSEGFVCRIALLNKLVNDFHAITSIYPKPIIEKTLDRNFGPC